MEAQGIDMSVGVLQLGDFFTGKVGWETILPELVFAFDFALGLRSWGIKEANVVELESPAQLSESARGFSEKDAVVIDVELQGTSVGQEGCGEKIEVRQQEFSVVELGADEESAAIVEHIEHRKIDGRVREPRVRGGIQLPELADLRALPATDWGLRLFRERSMGVALL